MWDTICQQNIHRLTNKTASRTNGWDGSAGHIDGYDASQWIKYCNTVKLVWRGEIQHRKGGLGERMRDVICHLKVHRRTNKTSSRPTDWNGIVVLLDGYDAS